MTDKKIENKKRLKLRRKIRGRQSIVGTAERPRMSVFRSARHVYVQIIDDAAQRTLVSASSFEKGNHGSANIEGCLEVGKRIAARCKEKNIQQVVFDRNGNRYHGRVKAVADGARENGLQF